MDNKKNGIPKLRFPGFTGAWEQRKLSSMTQYKNGKGHEDKQTDSGDFELVNLNSISIDGGFKHSGKFINESDDGILYKNDLVMILSDVGHGDLLGRVALIPDDNKFILNQRVALLRPNKTVNPEFLFFYINSHQKYFKSQGAGMSQLNISKKSVETFSSLVPNIDEQKKISLFLMKLDSLIALHQRKLEHLQEQKKGLLQKMFPKNGETVPEVRFPGFTDAWEQRKLGEYGYFYYGKSAPKWSVVKEGGTPCIRYGELYTKFNSIVDRVYSRTNIDVNKLKLSKGGEVLVPRVGEDPLDFANCAYLPFPNIAIGEMISVFNTKQNPLFMTYYFNSQLRREFAKRVEGGNVSNLYYAYLENIKMSVPKKEEQDKISTFIKDFDTLISLHQRKLDHLELMKKGLLQQMFV